MKKSKANISSNLSNFFLCIPKGPYSIWLKFYYFLYKKISSFNIKSMWLHFIICLHLLFFFFACLQALTLSFALFLLVLLLLRFATTRVQQLKTTENSFRLMMVDENRLKLVEGEGVRSSFLRGWFQFCLFFNVLTLFVYVYGNCIQFEFEYVEQSCGKTLQNVTTGKEYSVINKYIT